MRRMVRIALWVGAVFGSVCIVATVAALAFGIKPLIFRSGSMEPDIGTGALAFTRTVPASDLRPGDVACVEDQTGQRITHRVVAVDAVAGSTATLRLKGDANADEDAQPYHVETAGRVLFHVEKLGYAVVWLSGPQAVFAGGVLVGLLVAVAVRPGWLDRREDASDEGGSGARLTAGTAVAVAALALVSTVRVPSTAAAYTDTATGVTGGLVTKAAFVPRIDRYVSGSSYVTCSDKSVSGPDPVTLTWSHLGAPYRYRIILRDLDGMIWRTWDVTPTSGKTGDPVSFAIDGTGMPSHAAIWRYDAEIHTMLPGPPTSSGAVSTDWRGIGVSQHIQLGNEDLYCSTTRGEQSGSAAYVPPPTSVTCVSQPAGTQPARAVLSWPHLGSPYTYNVSVRNENNRNIVLRRTVTSVPAQAGQPVSTTVLGSDLDSGVLSGTTAIAEIRTVNGGAESAGFVTQRLTVGKTATACAATALARSAPDAATTTAPVSGSSSTTAQAQPTPTSDTAPATGAPTGGASPTGASATTTPADLGTPPSDTVSTPPAGPTSATAETTTPPPPVTALTTATSEGGRQARLVQDGQWWVVVVDGSGAEVTRTAATPDTRMHWLSGADQLWLSSAAGPVYLDESTGWRPTAPDGALPAEVQAAFG
ncbi:signal peptidase I [Rhodococcus sp. SGAir0479]|uniref:signal peptidase I n=1 Tax=Rhodococcus sp. SGAir0479 TaxID=2567884 RepID=UPI0010CCDCC5|nr:signal peptidase I [Rhodococcus sp. SGAir0479]QCQ90548.1 signal peptidase I [Rhodococcus sp. SGAir0479]